MQHLKIDGWNTDAMLVLGSVGVFLVSMGLLHSGIN